MSPPRSARPARLETVSPQLGQLLLVGFRGTDADADADLERLICRVRVGGLLLFGRNVVEPSQVSRLTARAREIARGCGAARLLIAVDAEGGQVMRLGPAAGYTPTLSARELGASNDLSLAELEGLRIGQMLRSAGINWNLAPVVDVGYNPANPVIVGYGRSFGADPPRHRAGGDGFAACAPRACDALKHFPATAELRRFTPRLRGRHGDADRRSSSSLSRASRGLGRQHHDRARLQQPSRYSLSRNAVGATITVSCGRRSDSRE